jgi:hypothetical protein
MSTYTYSSVVPRIDRTELRAIHTERQQGEYKGDGAMRLGLTLDTLMGSRCPSTVGPFWHLI